MLSAQDHTIIKGSYYLFAFERAWEGKADQDNS